MQYSASHATISETPNMIAIPQTEDRPFMISWLRQCLEESGLTNRDLSRRLDRSSNYVQHLLSGKGRFTRDLVIQIAQHTTQVLPDGSPLPIELHLKEDQAEIVDDDLKVGFGNLIDRFADLEQTVFRMDAAIARIEERLGSRG